MSNLTAEELVRGTINGAYTLALRLTGNSSDAWDLTQEALLRAIRALPGFREESKPDTWVYRIVINVWKNERQSLARRWWSKVFPLDPRGAGAGARSSEASADRAAQDADDRSAFEAALSRLDPADRAALVLRELDGKSYQEISELLGIPMGTVKSRLHRARSILAGIWEEEHGA